MPPDEHELATFYFDSSRKTFSTRHIKKALGHNDVLVRTTHSGLCYTDVHAKSKGCGLGHEGVGLVVNTGPAVKHLKPGDRVGWGWLLKSCRHCSTCVTGYRQYCSEARGFGYCDLDQGAFSDYRIVDSDFAYLLPDSIASLHAGPLMCAGASVYEALDAAGVKPNDRVGVVGIGGLGHMAIMFARAFGCSVTALSNGSSKMQDAFDLGASEFRDLSEISTAHDQQGSITDATPMNINVILITSNKVPAMEIVLPLLARRATIVLMTIQEEAITVPYMQFILPGHRMLASTEASRENHIKMLEFVQRHPEVRPWTEVFSMTPQGLEQAFKRLESGQMRYRGVLVNPCVLDGEGCANIRQRDN